MARKDEPAKRSSRRLAGVKSEDTAARPPMVLRVRHPVADELGERSAGGSGGETPRTRKATDGEEDGCDDDPHNAAPPSKRTRVRAGDAEAWVASGSTPTRPGRGPATESQDIDPSPDRREPAAATDASEEARCGCPDRTAPSAAPSPPAAEGRAGPSQPPAAAAGPGDGHVIVLSSDEDGGSDVDDPLDEGHLDAPGRGVLAPRAGPSVGAPGGGADRDSVDVGEGGEQEVYFVRSPPRTGPEGGATDRPLAVRREAFRGEGGAEVIDLTSLPAAEPPRDARDHSSGDETGSLDTDDDIIDVRFTMPETVGLGRGAARRPGFLSYDGRLTGQGAAGADPYAPLGFRPRVGMTSGYAMGLQAGFTSSGDAGGGTWLTSHIATMLASRAGEDVAGGSAWGNITGILSRLQNITQNARSAKPAAQGTPARVLRRLRTLRLPEASGESCVVCLDEMRKGDEVCNLPCSHGYHKSCIHKWLKRSRVCPVCKRDVERAQSDAAGPP